MTAADSFPTLAAHTAGRFAYRSPLGRECREALSTIDRLRASSCTPAERALIDAAVALRRRAVLRGDDRWEKFIAAADAVLAERGEA